MKRVYFVRHGETEGNLQKFFQFPETELSEAGHNGGKAVARRCETLGIDMLVASNFTRAQQTAKHISECIDIPVTTVDFLHESYRPENIRGVSIEAEEGQVHKKEYENEFWNKDWRPVGAENYFDVAKRVTESIDYLETTDSNKILVVSHGDFIRSMSAYLLLNKNTEVEQNRVVFESLQRMSNVAITEFIYEDGKWKLFMWNDHAHFAE